MTKTNDIIWLDETKSTNEYARSHIERLDNLSVVAALSQTQGRGQGNHKWHSQKGQNLTFSVILKNPQIKASGQSVISDTTAKAVVCLLENHGIEAWIKPPNDIWVEDKKICGLLIEHSLRADHISWTIIGIGLNVNQISFPEELPNPTSMALEGHPADIQDVLAEFMGIFTQASWLR